MRFAKSITVGAPVEAAWLSLWDVERLASCLPSCHDVSVVEEGKSYRATITERIGPMSVNFPLAITVLEVEPPRHIRVGATGDDRRVASRVAADIDLTLSFTSEGGTEIAIASVVVVHGRLASLGEAVIGRRAEAELDAFTTALARLLDAPEAA